MLEGRAPTIHGDGEQTRDFTYIANVVDGVLRACEAPRRVARSSTSPSAGASASTSCARRWRRCWAAPCKPEYKPPRAGDVRDSQADITKAREILGYEPIVSFEEGLRRTLEWYKAEHALAATRT